MDWRYLAGLVIGSLLPDFDHHSSVVNRKILFMMDLTFKVCIVAFIFGILEKFIANELILGAIAIVSFAFIYAIEFNQKVLLRITYGILGLYIFSVYGFNIKSMIAASTTFFIGFFPHREFTHKWYGVGLISLSLYLLLGLNTITVSVILGVLIHILADKIYSSGN